MARSSSPPFSRWWPVLGRTCIQHQMERPDGEALFPWLLNWLERRGFSGSMGGKKVLRAWGEERGIRFFFRLRYLLVFKRNRLRIIMWGSPQVKGAAVLLFWNWFVPFFLFGLLLHFHLHLNSLQDALEEDLREHLATRRPEPTEADHDLPLPRRSFFDRLGAHSGRGENPPEQRSDRSSDEPHRGRSSTTA